MLKKRANTNGPILTEGILEEREEEVLAKCLIGLTKINFNEPKAQG